jgi:hypothetical protein
MINEKKCRMKKALLTARVKAKEDVFLRSGFFHV